MTSDCFFAIIFMHAYGMKLSRFFPTYRQLYMHWHVGSTGSFDLWLKEDDVFTHHTNIIEGDYEIVLNPYYIPNESDVSFNGYGLLGGLIQNYAYLIHPQTNFKKSIHRERIQKNRVSCITFVTHNLNVSLIFF